VNGMQAKSNLRVELSADDKLVCCQGDTCLGPYCEDALDLAENLEHLRARQNAPRWSERLLAAARRLMSWRGSSRMAP